MELQNNLCNIKTKRKFLRNKKKYANCALALDHLKETLVKTYETKKEI